MSLYRILTPKTPCTSICRCVINQSSSGSYKTVKSNSGPFRGKCDDKNFQSSVVCVSRVRDRVLNKIQPKSRVEKPKDAMVIGCPYWGHHALICEKANVLI